ncbi:Ig domain-containing protein [Arenimonas terrae]|uniref:Uncharacterized protein n=1 Tax=Arenimonas terrae TaxID=2546226 RepID=A0A5C4RP31_9GAMM|nr:Ig domain-containing protein [Arenimonas terrae]TNJ32872.1 hypothetical protein E1B00_14260 [Arenimonas terrae]
MRPSAKRSTLPSVIAPLARLGLVSALAWASAAAAVDQPSTYPGCATRAVTVPWGGSVKVDLATCQSFGLGDVATPPAHGTAAPGGSPADSYTYSHKGAAPAGGGTDTFVVLDDNSDRITVTVTIQAGTSSIVATPGELPPLSAGTPVRQTLAASGGTAPYRFRVDSGALPKGLALAADGALSGTPTERGAYGFGVRVQDARGQSATLSYGGTVQGAAMSLSPEAVIATPGVAFRHALTVRGGVAPHQFTLEPGPALPAGVAIGGDGVVTASASVAPGRYPVSLRVTDASTGTGRHFELERFTLGVGGLPSASIEVTPAAVAEDGGQPLVFTISLDAAVATDTSVTLAASALPGAPAAVTIPAGATRARLVVRPTADATAEPDEVVAFAVADGSGYTIGSPARAAGTIRNDDTR